MTDFDKLLANLRFGTEDLSKDVDTAVAQIERLNKKAKLIDDAFKGDNGTTSGNLKKMTAELLEVSKNMTKVSSDIAKKYEETAKRVKTAQVSMTEQIKHNVETNKQSFEEAYQSAKKYRDVLQEQLAVEEKTNWGKAMNAKRYNKPISDYNPIDTDATKRQIMEVERLMAKIQTDMTKAEAEKAKEREKSSELERKSLREDLDYKRNVVYAEDKASYKAHLEEMIALEKEESNSRKILERELVDVKKAIQKEDEANLKASNARKANELKEHKAKAKAIVDKLFAEYESEYKGNYQEFKEHCEKTVNLDELTKEQQIRLLKKLSSLEKQEAREREKELKDRAKLEKKALDETNKALTAKQPTIDKNTPIQKFDNISNYVFDAGLIYGAINGVKQLSTELVGLEANMANLQRVAPNMSATQVNAVTNELMNIAGLTNNTVDNVQDIANYWVRVSDEISNNTELLEYLTNVTSTAMNVGGFENAEEAVQLLSASINQMGLEWQDAGRILDGWMKIADETAVGSAKDLADNVLRTGTQAQMLGLNIDQLNGIMGIFANNMAKSGEEVGTAMKTVFSYFTDPKTIDILYSHGVNVMKNAEEYRDFTDVLVDLRLKYKELEKTGNDVAIREMNNALGRTRRVDYVGTLIDNFDQFDDLVMKSVDSMGYANEQNEKLMDTLEAQINRLKVAFTQLAKGLGDSGMLDDFKMIVEFGVDAMDAINGMDDSTKRFLLTLAELSVAFTLAQKASKLMWGSKLTEMIADSIARVALMTKNQKLLNMAIQAGARVEATSAMATTGETGAVIANTMAKSANNNETLEGNVLGEAEIAQSGRQAVANMNEAGTYVAVANAKMKANASSGLLSGAIAGLVNPVNLAIGAIALLTAGLLAYKRSAEKAKEESLRLAEAKKTLAEKVAMAGDKTAVVDEFELGNMTQLVGQIDEAKRGYDEAVKKLDELNAKKAELDKKQSETSTKISTIGGSNGSMMEGLTNEVNMLNSEMAEAKSAIEMYEYELANLGSTAGTAKDDMLALEEIIARSSNEHYREGMAVVDVIEKYQKKNDEIRELIGIYSTLAGRTDLSADETDRLARAVAILSGSFPELKITAKDAEDAIRSNSSAMRDAVGATGQLTVAQQNEVFAMANLSENAKTMAVNALNAQIDTTRGTIKEIRTRISAYQAEANAMNSLARQASKNNYRTSSGNLLVSDGQFFSQERYKSVSGNMANLKVDMSELKKAEQTLKYLEAQLSTIKSITPTKAHDTSADKAPYVPESEKKKAEQNAKDAERIAEEARRVAEQLMRERERAVMDMQSKIVSALKAKYAEDKNNRIKALKEMEKAEVKVLDERIKKLREEIEALQDTREDERNNIESLKKNLEMWKRDDSELGKRKVRELEKQIAEEEKALLIKNKEEEIKSIEEQKQAVIDSYQARLDMDSEHYDKQLQIIDNATKEVNLYKEANALINGNVTAQQKILDLLTEYIPEYASIGQVMGESMADSMMREVQEAMEAIKGLRQTGNSETGTSVTPPSSGGSTSPTTPAPTPAPTKPSPSPAPSTSSGNTPPIRRGYSSRGEKLSPNSSLVDYMKSKGYYSAFNDRKAIYDYYSNKGLLPKGTYSGSGSQNASMWDRLKKDGFDTGGYTGEWGSSGKFAMLHQKERVLNAQQTKAFEHLIYNFLPKLNLGNSIGAIGKSVGTIINNNAPLIQNDINITNNTPFDVSNKMDNLNRAIKAELQNIGYNRSIGGRR